MDAKVPLVIVSMALSVLTGLVLARGKGEEVAHAKSAQPVIGLSLDTLKEARWQADRAAFVRYAGELGARVLDVARRQVLEREAVARGRARRRVGHRALQGGDLGRHRAP